MAMSKHTREKLREHARKNKGRTNLMGLDRSSGLAGVDYVMEHCEQAVKRWRFHADGSLMYDSIPGEEFGRFLSSSICRTHYHEGKPLRSRYSLRCPWVRMGYTAEWIKDELAMRWPHRFISYTMRGETRHDRVFPVGVVCEFMRFLWPTWEEFGPRAEKYVNGYSDGYILRNPGKGTTLKMTGPFRNGELCKVTGVNSYRVDVAFVYTHHEVGYEGLTGSSASIEREVNPMWEVVG